MKKSGKDEQLFSMPVPEKDNSKKIKTLMGVCIALGVVFVVLLVGSVLLKSVSVKEVLAFPPSGLSNSIFDSQNGAYTASEYFPYKRCLKLSPYCIDVPSENSADVGMGTSYTISGMDLAYVTEYGVADRENRERVIVEELGKAYVMELSMDNCVVQEMSPVEEGFLNGYFMRYVTYAMQFADASGAGYVVYVQGYEVEVSEEGVLFFAISTTTGTNDSLAYYKQWLDIMALTLRYDNEVAEELERAKQQVAKEEQERAEQAEQEKAEQAEQEPKDNAQSYYEQWYQSQHETVQVVADGSGTQKVDCETESAYKKAVFKFLFSEPTADFAYHMVDPDGQVIEMSDLTVTSENGLVAIYEVSESKKGIYSIVFDQGGCTYVTPAFAMDSHVAYTSDELRRMELEEYMKHENEQGVPISDENNGVVVQ